MFEDVTGKPLDVGDVVAYTASAGQAVSGINVGRITRMTKATVWVKDVDPVTYETKQRAEGYRVPDGPEKVQYPGTNYEYRWQPQRFVQTHEVDVDETAVGNPKPHRFLILKKI